MARGLEAWRQRCVELEQDGHRAREQLARVQVERATLEVKLKHARNQVQVEMRRRQRAEAELEKQVRGMGLATQVVLGPSWRCPLTHCHPLTHRPPPHRTGSSS